MSIAIGTFNLNEYRHSIQALSDEDLIKEGKTMCWLSGDGKIVSMTPCAFYEQLKVCREEYQRRHPPLKQTD
jgi:predicted transcriptional regulator